MQSLSQSRSTQTFGKRRHHPSCGLNLQADGEGEVSGGRGLKAMSDRSAVGFGRAVAALVAVERFSNGWRRTSASCRPPHKSTTSRHFVQSSIQSTRQYDDRIYSELDSKPPGGQLLSSDFGRVCSNRCPSQPLRMEQHSD